MWASCASSFSLFQNPVLPSERELWHWIRHISIHKPMADYQEC